MGTHPSSFDKPPCRPSASCPWAWGAAARPRQDVRRQACHLLDLLLLPLCSPHRLARPHCPLSPPRLQPCPLPPHPLPRGGDGGRHPAPGRSLALRPPLPRTMARPQCRDHLLRKCRRRLPSCAGHPSKPQPKAGGSCHRCYSRGDQPLPPHHSPQHAPHLPDGQRERGGEGDGGHATEEESVLLRQGGEEGGALRQHVRDAPAPSSHLL